MSHRPSSSSSGIAPAPDYSTHPDGYRLPAPSYATVAAGRPRARGQQASAAHSRTSSNPTSASNSREQLVPPPRTMDLDGAPREAAAGSNTRARPRTSSASRWDSGGLGCSTHDDHPLFFIPSYLKHSRHVERVEEAWEDHLAELSEHASKAAGGRQIPLSSSSSSLNLSKMPAPHVHRGVAQEVVERVPPSSSDPLHPLPGRWSEDDKMSGLDILADGTEVRFNGITKTSDEAAAVRSDYAMPKECGLYYFEVTILSRGKDGLIGIGFSGRKANLNRLPGWENESWAYHGDDGYVFACTASGKAYGPRFAAQDVIGCGVNFRTGHAFFTKNGVHLGVAFSGLKNTDRLYPSVGMKRPGEHLRANFGRSPFVFDIDALMQEERRIVAAEVSKADASKLRRGFDENALVHNLIGQYLAHEGYVETAKAFFQDVQEREQSLREGAAPPPSMSVSNDEDDIHAINRQRIRKSILDGDIDRALKYTSSYYPHVLQEERNRDIYFRLRCRKFIEMMRLHAELGAATPSHMTATRTVGSYGRNDAEDREVDGNDGEDDNDETEDPPNTQMELDEQLHRETSKGLEPAVASDDVDMDASQDLPPKGSSLKANELISAALAYGQELQLEFGADKRPATQKALQDIFALVAYSSVNDSPVSHLFDKRARVGIAEGVNGAILVSLGKPSSAALEKLCALTETMLEETALKTGGAAAMVNVEADFLSEGEPRPRKLLTREPIV